MVVPLPATESGKCQHLFVYVGFSNRPFRVKRFQTIQHYSVDVAHGLVLLFGLGTKALPSWDSRTRRNNLYRGLAGNATTGPNRRSPNRELA
jgi:hypothetical protein